MDPISVTGSLVVSGITSTGADLLYFGMGALFAGFSIVWGLVCLAIWILVLVAHWKVFTKAWKPGWGCLIPIYNIYLMFKIAGRPGGRTRWILFPPVLCVLAIVAQFDIAKRFGKDVWYGFGLWLLPFVFYPLIAFGEAKYHSKPSH